jgi:hypothetical protein
MTCEQWQARIAEGESAEGHVEQCQDCAEFARSLSASLALLQEAHAEPLPEAHYTALRARVMEQVGTRRRFGWWWAAAAAGLAAMLWMLAALPRPVPKPPAVARRVEIPPPPPPLPAAAHPATVRRVTRRRVAPPEQPLKIKLLTEDPNIVIYWIVDNKGDY